jgi:hypothetical protein
MSPRSSSPKKPKGPPPDPDIYVGLLFVAVAALTCGCIMLALELNSYGWALPTG